MPPRSAPGSEIREATRDDLECILDVERRAFSGDMEAALVRALLDDPGAAPRLSLLASLDGKPAGHILFTAASVGGGAEPVGASILAPLAVVPEMQRRGCGGALVAEGLRRLAAAKTALVFVLGDPAYYGRFGFSPAGALGFDPPCPVAAAHADAWMVRALRSGSIGTVSGRVQVAKALDRPELWRE